MSDIVSRDGRLTDDCFRDGVHFHGAGFDASSKAIAWLVTATLVTVSAEVEAETDPDAYIANDSGIIKHSIVDPQCIGL